MKTEDTGDSLREWLDDGIDRAARAMSRELGDDSVCTVHKDGRVTGGLKYQEGRMSALAELRRELRTRSLDAALDQVEERWSAEFERTRASASASPAWASYATGGLDAIREACAEIGRSTPA